MTVERKLDPGFVETYILFCHRAKGQKVPIIEGWLPLKDGELGSEASLIKQDDIFDRILYWKKLVRWKASPGQIFLIGFNPKTREVQGRAEYVGLWKNEEDVKYFKRMDEEFEQRREEDKTRKIDSGSDPMAPHFEALRNEYQRRHGVARRAFLSRLFYELDR